MTKDQTTKSKSIKWLYSELIVLLLLSVISITTSGFVNNNEPVGSSHSVIKNVESIKQKPSLTPETEVLAYVGGKDDWKLMPLKYLEKGQEFKFDNHLCYVDKHGLIRMNPSVDVNFLLESDRIYDKDNWRFPEAGDVVRFVNKDSNKHLRHDRMGTLVATDHFFFQGLLYEVVQDEGSTTHLSIRNTGIVLSRITHTTKRNSDTLIDLTIEDEEGIEFVISGTPEHPFFIPEVNSYVAMGKLKLGAILKTDNGSLATVKGSKTHHSKVTVYNFEVKGTHNYFVSSPDGGPMVNVHNVCKWDDVVIGEHALQPKHNWSKIFGNNTPTLSDIRPHIDDVLKNGTWNKIGDARGKGGKIIGEILQAEHNGIWVRGFKDLNGKIIVNNAGTL